MIAADVYSEPPHISRGGWTWYTGSAGWMYQAGATLDDQPLENSATEARLTLNGKSHVLVRHFVASGAMARHRARSRNTLISCALLMPLRPAMSYCFASS